MRTIDTDIIKHAVKDLCISANLILPNSIEEKICHFAENEPFPPAQSVLEDIKKNIVVAKEMNLPICQDTGMAIVFIEIGQDVHLTGKLLRDAVNEGVAQGYKEGHLRCSIVSDPISRVNTNDNTPCVLHTEIVLGDKINITVAPKGFGSENMSAIRMFTPSATVEDITDFVVETVVNAGSNPCPPIVAGVGIGGDFELCALLAKKALCRDVAITNQDEFYSDLERKILEAINQSGVGPQGFGGKTTALAVNIETYPTHIAGLPVAVNIGCHVTRHAHMQI